MSGPDAPPPDAPSPAALLPAAPLPSTPSPRAPSGGLPPLLAVLDAVTAEIEAFVASGGWDQPPALFALVPTATVAADPQGAALLGLTDLGGITSESLTPIAQDALPDQPLDEALAGVEWPPQVTGCALAQEIVVLPPEAEAGLSSPDAVAEAAAHPDRREARLVVAVLRDGRTSSVLRLRGSAGSSGSDDRSSSAARPSERGDDDEIAFGAELAPNLTAALLATLA